MHASKKSEKNGSTGSTSLQLDQPFAGLRLVLTFPRQRMSELLPAMLAMGAEVVPLPVLRLEPPADLTDLDEVIRGLGGYDWLVFTDEDAVDAFFGRFFELFEDMRELGPARIAAVGIRTAQRIRAFHLKADVVCACAPGPAVAKAIDAFETVVNLKVCVLRGAMEMREISRAMEARGAIVDEVQCYQLAVETNVPTGLLERVRSLGADWILFASPEAVQHFQEQYGLVSLMTRFPHLKLASIDGPTTDALRALRLEPVVQAVEQTAAGLCAAVEAYVRKSTHRDAPSRP